MPPRRPANAFGIDTNVINGLDWGLAVNRILTDVKSDFIYAPHLRYIYSKCSEELVAIVKSELSSGLFTVGTPITIDVPKSNRVRLANSKGSGPNFTRPGTILLPKDRLLYQILGDGVAALIDGHLVKDRVFSHMLSTDDPTSMFVPTRSCWNGLQTALQEYIKTENISHVIKIDIANYFGSINQHTLINILTDIGYNGSLCNRLENMLVDFAGDRSSRGIIQGVFTSDLLGNFYMMPIDRFVEEYGLKSARYVDDIYVFISGIDESHKFFQELIIQLRNYDLILNEAKTYIIAKHLLVSEEPDLEQLFAEAIAEITEQMDDDDLSEGYGFQMDWEDIEDDDNEEDDEDGDANEDEDEDDKEGDLELRATERLFDSIPKYPGHEESIERFCIPIFQKAKSRHALNYVMVLFDDRPSMTQIYASYLSSFIDDDDVVRFLQGELTEESYSDWQKMWVVAALLQKFDLDAVAIRTAYNILVDARRHDGLRAVAAILVGKFGDFARRKSLISIYPTVSDYVKSAIYFSTMYWGSAEKRNARASWGSHGVLNTLITEGMSKK